MRSKAKKLDETTARTYADALDQRILPVLGDYFYDEVTTEDVQDWIDSELERGWRTRAGETRDYQAPSIHSPFRVFRTMTRDAVQRLRLRVDPTLRVDLPDIPESDESKALSASELAVVLAYLHDHYPQHFALVVVLVYTGLRFCHASALRWEDWDEDAEDVGILKVQRKQVRGVVGQVSKKKRAPKTFPVRRQLADVLRWHRQRLLREQAPGLSEGWMFPSRTGTLRSPSSLTKAWKKAVAGAKIERRVTVHGLRYTFTDLTRRGGIDPIVRRALTGHVTVEMQRRYSSVGLDEKDAALARVFEIAPLPVIPS
jgi:integrase